MENIEILSDMEEVTVIHNIDPYELPEDDEMCSLPWRKMC